MNCKNQLSFSLILGVPLVMQGRMSELDAYVVLSVLLIFFVCATIDYVRSRWLERPLFRRLDVFLEKYHWQ